MNYSQFDELLSQIQTDESRLREAGQKEYAHDKENVFANFDRVGNQVRCVCEHCGESTRIGRMATLMVYFLKHVDGIISYVGGHKSQREPVGGRINDARVYLALLKGMEEEDNYGENTFLLTRKTEEEK